MKKTIVILVMLVALVSNSFGAEKPNETVAKGVYTLVTVNGFRLPATVSHGGHDIMVHSGTFTINADKTCVSKIVFGASSGDKITRQVKASYTQEGTTLNMQWDGAGRTKGAVEGDTFTMNNEGMSFSYKIDIDAKSSSAAVKAFELRMQGKSDEAKEFLKKGLKENPKDAKGWFELARIEMYLKPGESNGAYEQGLNAQRAVKKSTELDPDNSRAHYLEGYINKNLGVVKLFTKGMPGDENFADAVKHFERAIQLKPDYHEARLELIEFHNEKWPFKTGANKKKAAEYKKILLQDPVCGAMLRCDNKSREEKLAIWEKAIAEHKDNPAAYAQAALEYMYKRADKPMSHMVKAQDYLDKAIELDPSQSVYLLELAESYRWRKDHVSEEKVLRQLVNMDNQFQLLQAEGLYLLAENMQKQGKSDEAAKLISTAKQLDPVRTQNVLPMSEHYKKP